MRVKITNRHTGTVRYEPVTEGQRYIKLDLGEDGYIENGDPPATTPPAVEGNYELEGHAGCGACGVRMERGARCWIPEKGAAYPPGRFCRCVKCGPEKAGIPTPSPTDIVCERGTVGVVEWLDGSGRFSLMWHAGADRDVSRDRQDCGKGHGPNVVIQHLVHAHGWRYPVCGTWEECAAQWPNWLKWNHEGVPRPTPQVLKKPGERRNLMDDAVPSIATTALTRTGGDASTSLTAIARGVASDRPEMMCAAVGCGNTTRERYCELHERPCGICQRHGCEDMSECAEAMDWAGYGTGDLRVEGHCIANEQVETWKRIGRARDRLADAEAMAWLRGGGKLAALRAEVDAAVEADRELSRRRAALTAELARREGK